MPSNFSWKASGNISPSRFVTAATASAFYVTQATGTADPIVGISQPGTQGPAGTPFDDGYAANDGDPLVIFDNPYEDQVLLLTGLPVTAGQLLTSDSSGRGVPVTATGQYLGAMSLQTQASGTLCRVRPYFGNRGG